MVIEEVKLQLVKYIVPVVTWVVGLILFFVIYHFFIRLLTKGLMYKAKNKKERDNIRVFVSFAKYVVMVVVGLFLFFLLTGSFTGLGIVAGLMTAGLGLALQRPVTGMAAWLMIIFKKPFQIDDRIIIGDIRGDVENITVSHIHLREVGGTTGGDELSGRIIIVPTSILFEKDIINYTLDNDYVLDEIKTLISYESNLTRAKKICEDAAKKNLKNQLRDAPKRPAIRVEQADSGIILKTHYFVRSFDRPRVFSLISEAIIRNIAKSKSVNIAYPHLRILRKD